MFKLYVTIFEIVFQAEMVWACDEMRGNKSSKSDYER